MGKSNSPVVEQAGSEKFELAQLESLSQQVVVCMQSLRELLCLRATALEDCRMALEEYHLRLMEENEQLAQRENELCDQFEARQAELAAREQRVDEDVKLQESQNEAFRRQQAELDSRLAQIKRSEESIGQQQKVLMTSQKELGERTVEIVKEQKNLESARQQLAAAEAQLEAGRREIERQAQASDSSRRELAAMQRDWEARMKEMTHATQSLTALQDQVTCELDKLTEQHDDLLPHFGASEGGDAKKQAKAGLPAPADAKARESLKRFQKLCRDAKRRAVGAG